MARFSAFLGHSVEVGYRAGDISLPAFGTLVADSGRSIFLEQHYELRGQSRNFSWEIPYPCIIRLRQIDASTVEDRLLAEPVSASPRPVRAKAVRASAGSSVSSVVTQNDN